MMASEESNITMEDEERLESVPSHLFVELTSLAGLSFPTTASSRIKYTCVCASPHLLTVGSSSGTVYLFSRYAAKKRNSLCNVPVQVIPCQEGAITRVDISPDEKLVAVATSRGFLCVLNISRNHSTTLLNSVLHVGAEITCFRFSLDGSRLFAGDNLGRVSCSKLSSKLSLRSPCELLLRLDSRVVQIDQYHSQLLVSTLSRCYLHHMARQVTCQIGSKLRNGNYGACFFSNDAKRDAVEAVPNGSTTINNCAPLIFSARPGGRLWEVDEVGKVYSTHKFSSLRSTWGVPGFRDLGVLSSDNAGNITFGNVYVISEFLLSAGSRTLILVDPKRGKLVLVADLGEDISQYCVSGNDVFLLTAEGYLRKVTIFPLEKAVEKLQCRERFMAAAQVVCAVHQADETYHFRTDLLRGIRAHLEGLPEADRLIEKIDAIVEQESSYKALESNKSVKVPQVARLASGIHKVIRGMENSGYEDDFTFRLPASRISGRSSMLSKSPYNSLTRRSKSTSSVNKLTTATGANGHFDDAFADVPLDGEGEKLAQRLLNTCVVNGCQDAIIPNDDNHPAVSCCMIQSRSEESLVALLSNEQDHLQLHEEGVLTGESAKRCEWNDFSPANFRNSQPIRSSVDESDAEHLPSAERVPSNTNVVFGNIDPTNGGRVNVTAGALKETLKTGGKLLVEAVQKMSLLNMGPDFADPTFLVNGFDEDSDENQDDRAETPLALDGEKMASGVVTSHIVSDLEDLESDNLIMETPVVQRVLRPTCSGRTRPKRASGDRTNEYDAYGRVVRADTARDNEVEKGSDRMKIEIGESEVAAGDAQCITEQQTKLIRCEFCGLHNTWRFIFTVGPFVDKFDFVMDYFKEGGVPVDAASWRDLLLDWSRRKSRLLARDKVCVACGQLYETWMSYQKESNENITGENDANAESICGALAHFPESALKNVFQTCGKRDSLADSQVTLRGSDTTPEVESAELAKPACGRTMISLDHNNGVEASATGDGESPLTFSMYYNPLYESVYDADHEITEAADVFKWLPSVPLDVLLSVCVKVIGIDATMEVVLETVPKFCDDITNAFYRQVGPADTACVLNSTVLQDIAADAFNLTLNYIRPEESNQHASRAMRIDVRDFCPCCTLALTSTVAENDQRVYIFDCGHSYHKVCLLSHAKPPYSCLVCTGPP